jgi:hypothetical protein
VSHLSFAVPAGPSGAIGPRTDIESMPRDWFDSRGRLKFVKATPDVRYASDLTNTEKSLLLEIKAWDRDGRGCWVYDDTLIHATGLKATGPDRGKRALRRLIEGVAAKGKLEVERVRRSSDNPTGRIFHLPPEPALDSDRPTVYRSSEGASTLLGANVQKSHRSGNADLQVRKSGPPGPLERAPAPSPFLLDEEDTERRQTDASREGSGGAVGDGEVVRSSSSSLKVSRKTEKARKAFAPGPVEAESRSSRHFDSTPQDPLAARPLTPVAEAPGGLPAIVAGQVTVELCQDDDGVWTNREPQGPPSDEDDASRQDLIASIEEVARGEPEVRRALLDAVRDMLKTAKLAGSPSPYDHVRMAIAKADANPKRRGTIESLARGILRNWVDEGFPAIHAPEPPGKPKPRPDPAAEIKASVERRRAALAAEAEARALKARWDSLPGPEREAIESKVDREYPELAEIPDGLRKVARRNQCLEILGRREPPPGSPRAVEPVPVPASIISTPPVVARVELPSVVEPAPIRESKPSQVAPEPLADSLASILDRYRPATRGLSDPTPPPSTARADATEATRAKLLAQLQAGRAARIQPPPVVEPAPIRAVEVDPPPVEVDPPPKAEVQARPGVFRQIKAFVANFGIL